MEHRHSHSGEDIHELVTQSSQSFNSSSQNWGQQAQSSTTLPRQGAVLDHSLFSAETPSLSSSLQASPQQSFLHAAQYVNANSNAQTDQSLGDRQMQGPEKDSEDPTAPLEPARRHTTLRTSSRSPITTLSQIFAGPSSRLSSFTRPSPAGGGSYIRSSANDSGPLPQHLYSRGLLEGRHSDIDVVVFGQTYPLHRLILDRAPFFASALSAPWSESRQSSITLHPEDIDVNITQKSFELALKRLYGCTDLQEEQSEALSLLATGSWLEMDDLVSSSIAHILRRMDTGTLGAMVELVTSQYYGKAGEKVLASAKARLCRDGWQMPVECWDGIPSDVVRQLVGGDGFYIDTEFDRLVLAANLLNRRLSALASEAGFGELTKDALNSKIRDVSPRPKEMIDTIPDQLLSHGSEGQAEDWLALYSHPEIRPLLCLIDRGVHYVHMTFEQLQHVRIARDIFGFPLVPNHIISQALWSGVELRQRIVNAGENQDSLGLIRSALPPTASGSSAVEVGDGAESETTGPRRFWVPIADCNIIVGGSGEPNVTTSNASTAWQSNNASSVHKPTDASWFTDFMTERSIASPNNGGDSRPVSYSTYPPFRFGADFPNPRTLPPGKRVYSRTVVYAGSLWNVYIQRVKTSSRSPQLGIYLHRAKEREPDEIRQSRSPPPGSVDERIGALEREMLLRSEQRIRRHGRPDRLSLSLNTVLAPDQGSSSESSGAEADDHEHARPSLSSPLLRQSRKSVRHGVPDVAGQTPSTFDSATSPAAQAAVRPSLNKFSRTEAHGGKSWTPALPSYVDPRPTIKTYFKIYTPSKGGRMLSVYESAPDDFKLSQSWGWKSSTLLMDDDWSDAAADADDEMMNGGGDGSAIITGERKDGRLRCMVVLGIV